MPPPAEDMGPRWAAQTRSNFASARRHSAVALTPPVHRYRGLCAPTLTFRWRNTFLQMVSTALEIVNFILARPKEPTNQAAPSQIKLPHSQGERLAIKHGLRGVSMLPFFKRGSIVLYSVTLMWCVRSLYVAAYQLVTSTIMSRRREGQRSRHVICRPVDRGSHVAVHPLCGR